MTEYGSSNPLVYLLLVVILMLVAAFGMIDDRQEKIRDAKLDEIRAMQPCTTKPN